MAAAAQRQQGRQATRRRSVWPRSSREEQAELAFYPMKGDEMKRQLLQQCISSYERKKRRDERSSKASESEFHLHFAVFATFLL
jgi:hypothetical protein